jgi:hypothetical protein
MAVPPPRRAPKNPTRARVSARSPKVNVDRTRPICGYYSFTDYFGVKKATFKKTGAFDQIINRDSHLMIDPKLLGQSSTAEMRGSYDLVLQRFRQIFKNLSRSVEEGDQFWRAAYKLTDFSEFKGVALGYSADSGNGSGWARKLRLQVLRSAKQIVAAGLDDPEFFELLALFEDKIGSDRISDMIGTILIKPLCAYTTRVCSAMKVAVKQFPVRESSASLPWFIDEEGKERYIILVPRDVLSDLPVALNRAGISTVFAENEVLRGHLNATIGADWQNVVRTTKGKQVTRASFFENISTFERFIDRYRKALGTAYDFQGDPDNIRLWYEMARRALEGHPLRLTLPPSPTGDDLYAVVRKIVLHFKRLVESNRLREALFLNDRPRKEKIVQAVFFAVAKTHCEYNDLDIAPETDAGRGPVDFKLSRGDKFRVVVELKLSNSSKLKHGYETQLEEYKRAENTARAIYLVLDVGTNPSAVEKLRETARGARTKKGPELIIVSGEKRPSASKS